MFRHPRRPRHRIGVPRGILHHITLQILKKGPMSGSELMEEIEQYTDWRPSPGSIYPLLSHLSDEGVIEPHPDEDPSLKRFTLTKDGVRYLEDLKQYDEQLRSRHKSMRKIYWRLHREMPEDLYNSFAALYDKVEEAYTNAEGSHVAIQRLREVLDEATSKLEKISE